MMCGAKQQKLLELDEARTKIEKQISQLNKELSFYEEKNYHKSLVDEEGFPRADLDFGELTTYKNTKRRFNELNNDYKAIMAEIETNLEGMHQELQESGQAERDMEEYDKRVALMKLQAANEQEKKQFGEETEINEQTQDKQQDLQVKDNVAFPFAVINEVTDQSPSQEAGIRVGDLVVTFGQVNNYNHNELAYLIETVKANINKPIQVSVLRKGADTIPSETFFYKGSDYQKVELSLIPKTWKGQGVLGCRFKAL